MHLEAQEHVGHVEVRGQTSESLLRHCPLFVCFEAGSLTGQDLAKWASWLTSETQGSILLYPLSQCQTVLKLYTHVITPNFFFLLGFLLWSFWLPDKFFPDHAISPA